MRRHPGAILAFATAVVMMAMSAFGETVSYPEEKPLFTLEAPDGWDVHHGDDGSLTVQTPDANVVAVFDYRIKGVKDAATAQEAVIVQKDKTVETTGFTDLRVIEKVQEMRLSPEIKAFAAKYHAKFPSGEPCIYIVAIFSPDGSKYCSAELSIKASALRGEVEKQWQALLDSLAPVKGNDE